MGAWRQKLRCDPIAALLSSGDEALTYFVRRDLLDERVLSISSVWSLPEVEKLLKKQQSDGSRRHRAEWCVYDPGCRTKANPWFPSFPSVQEPIAVAQIPRPVNDRLTSCSPIQHLPVRFQLA